MVTKLGRRGWRMEKTYRDREGDDLECIMGKLLVLRLAVSFIRLGICETTVLKVEYRDDYLGEYLYPRGGL